MGDNGLRGRKEKGGKREGKGRDIRKKRRGE